MSLGPPNGSTSLLLMSCRAGLCSTCDSFEALRKWLDSRELDRAARWKRGELAWEEPDVWKVRDGKLVLVVERRRWREVGSGVRSGDMVRRECVVRL